MDDWKAYKAFLSVIYATTALFIPHAVGRASRVEHLLPLVALGAGGCHPATHAYRDHVLGWTVPAFRFG